jgi:hypothetical protein
MKKPPNRPGAPGDRIGLADWCNLGLVIVAVLSLMIMADAKLVSPSAGICFVIVVTLLCLQPLSRKGRQGRE